MDGLASIGQQVANVWAEMSTGRKITTVAGSLAAVALFSVLILAGVQQSYAPLLTGLTPEDAAEITQFLDENQHPYRVAGGGSAVLVPESEVHTLRLRLAGAGLPKGGTVGFEMFNEPDMSMSRFAEQLNYRRGLEGELRRTIRQLDTVKDARVHIVVPEKRLFARDREPSRASVTVQLHRGRRMGPEQVEAVTHLVAAAVPGLEPNQVTLVDAEGAILARGGDDRQHLDGALQHQREIEQSLAERVRQLVERAVGVGNATVTVSAEVDFDQRELKTETFDPEEPVVRSEQLSVANQNAAEASTAPAAGVPGTRTNLAGGEDAAASEGFQNLAKRTETRNYEISKSSELRVSNGGQVSRLSVAVLVDRSAVQSIAGDQPLDGVLDSIADVARKAVGFRTERGDQVVVEAMNFMTPELPSEEVTPEWLQWVRALWLPVVGVLSTLILSLFVLTLRRSAKRAEAKLLGAPQTVRDLEAVIERRNLNASGVEDGSFALASPTPDPERALAVVKTWLSEGEASS